MKNYQYKFTVESLESSDGNASVATPLIFEISNHDDLFKIVERMKGNSNLDETDATALAIGVKLFGEVMLKNKNNVLFKELKPHFGNFMKALKKAQ